MSLKGDKYETAEEVRFRLEHSVVMYDGEPVYINRVSVPEEIEEKGEIARVFFYNLPYLGTGREKETRKYLSSKKFDLTPLKLGYMNYLDPLRKGDPSRAVFVARSPIRQNKQGLGANSATFHTPKGNKDDRVNFGMMIATTGFTDMLSNKYPSFKEAGELLNEHASSVAISRSFAFLLDDDLDCLILSHKGSKCGLAFKGDKSIKVPPKFHFLKEEMEQHRIPIA